MNYHDLQFTYKLLFDDMSDEIGLYSTALNQIWLNYLSDIQLHFIGYPIRRNNKNYRCTDVVSHRGRLRLEFYRRDGDFIGINLLDLDNEKQLK